MTLDCALGIKPRDKVAIVGSGGKTELLWYLAQKNRGVKTLVTTTTKIFEPDAAVYDRHVSDAASASETCTGITLAASDCGGGKLKQLPQLEDIQQYYDVVLMECDGARRKPLKGWASYEPCIPAFATVIVGVIPVWPLGSAISEELIHRFSEFLPLADCPESPARTGLPLTAMHLANIVARGLFNKANNPVMRKVLFISQAESDETMRSARILSDMVKDCADVVVAGSARQGIGEIL